MQNQRATDSLWKQLEQPLNPAAQESLVATHGAENLLPTLLEFLRREKSGSSRAGSGCLGYMAASGVCAALIQFGHALAVGAFFFLIFVSPIALYLCVKWSHHQTPRRSNLLSLLRLTARALTNGKSVPELICAVRSVGSLEAPLLRQELRQELARLLLRLPADQAQRLTWSERAVLRGWLLDAMRWDQPGDSEFCLAVLLVLGDAHDPWVRLHAWCCARWHPTPQVREAAHAYRDALAAEEHRPRAQ